MPLRVIITEKPDVAKHVAEFFGYEKREAGAYRLKDGNYVTWMIGHMLDQGKPEDYMGEAQKAARGFAQLPILPEQFRHFPDPDKREQLRHIVSLLKKADIVVNAGDVDREGQLISDETLQYAGIDPAGRTKPVERVIIRANNHASLKAAFERAAVLNNGESQFVNRRLSGECRSEADWLVGMNGSRAVRAAIKVQLKKAVSVGRVQTPTLGLVVRRELEIRSFKSIAYFVPEVVLPDGRVLTWHSRADGVEPRGIDAEGRIIDRSVAEQIVRKIQSGLVGEVTSFESVEREQAPPLPFNLAKLQSEMSSRHGMSAKETSTATQSLYQNKKMVSYVGTDCQYLPTSMHAEAPEVLKGLSAHYAKVAGGTNPDIKYGCWNDAKVAAHHAIIPTGEIATGLSKNEQQVFDAVARRYMAQFYPKHKFIDNKLEAQYGEDEFRSGWKQSTVVGWKAVDEQHDEDEAASDGPRDKHAARLRSN